MPASCLIFPTIFYISYKTCLWAFPEEFKGLTNGNISFPGEVYMQTQDVKMSNCVRPFESTSSVFHLQIVQNADTGGSWMGFFY